MGYIRYDDTDELLCVFNAANFPIDFIVPKEFENGELFSELFLMAEI